MDEESAKGIPADFFISDSWKGNLTGAIWDEKRRLEFTVEISSDDCVLRPFGLKGVMYLAGKSNKGQFVPLIVNAQLFFDGSILSFMFDVGDNPSPDSVAIAGIFAVETIDNKVNPENNAVEVNHIRRFSEKSGFSLNGTISKGLWVYSSEYGTTGQGLTQNILCIEKTVNDIFKAIAGRSAIVTYTTNGEHMANSLHYSGNAVDLRTKDISPSQSNEIFQILKNQLDRNYDVVFKNDHIHIEYDPK